MNLRRKSDRRAIRGQTVRPRVLSNVPVAKWYPIKLVFEYRAYSGDRLVQTGAGETIEISAHALRLHIPRELPPQTGALDLSIAWPVALDGVTPLQWSVKAKPAWRAPGWIFVCIASHEFRIARARGRHRKAGHA